MGYVEGDFDKPHPKKLQQKAKTFSLDLQIWDEKDSFSETVFFLKIFLMGTRNAVLALLPKIFLQLPKIFRSSSACFEKCLSSGKKSFFLGMFLWTRSYKTLQPRRGFSWTGRTTLQQRPKVIKRYFFLKKLLEMFLWTSRMQFWQPRRYFSGKRRNFFALNSKNDGNKFFFAKKFSNCFCGHVECSFQNSASKNLSKGRNFFWLIFQKGWKTQYFD